MNENLNLVEILKDFKKGTKLYSPVFGEVEFLRIDNNDDNHPIVVLDKSSLTRSFDVSGKYCCKYDEAECLLFPSKNQRDWSKFKVKKSKFNPNTLQPFDKVLVKLNEFTPWVADLFSCIDGEDIICVGGYFNKVIPYNEDTKHLICTNETAPEFYEYWKD